MNCIKEVLYIVIPCYNEEEVLIETAKRLKEKLIELISNKQINEQSKILFVDDGSSDNTWNIIKKIHNEDVFYDGIKLSRNRGHQNALLSGLMYAKDSANIVISMDADLQDDISVIENMIRKYEEGFDIVYGVRSNRNTDTKFKKYTAEAFYKIINYLGGELVFNHADFRLMSKRALEGLSQFTEVNLFLRGIVPMIGYSSTSVFYERNYRFAGESKYPTRKMISFAIEGLTSLSVKPIRAVALLGILIFCTSIFMLIYSFIRYFMGATVSGWASVIVSVWAIGGLLLLSIGIIGEYIGKIYLETKERPRYIIEEILGDKFNT